MDVTLLLQNVICFQSFNITLVVYLITVNSHEKVKHITIWAFIGFSIGKTSTIRHMKVH
jgi:hypothetical protein